MVRTIGERRCGIQTKEAHVNGRLLGCFFVEDLFLTSVRQAETLMDTRYEHIVSIVG